MAVTHAPDRASVPAPDGPGGIRVPLPVKLAYAVGTLSESLKTFSFGLFLLFFYTSVLGLPGSLLGVALSIGLVWDSLLDPAIGHLSDRTRSAFGRRHGFMLPGSIGAGVCFFAMFSPPATLSTGGLFAWLIGCNLCLRLSQSAFMVPYLALGSELTPDYDERTSIAGVRAAAAMAGTLLAAAAAFLVFFPTAAAGQPDPKFSRDAYSAMALVFGTAITLSGLVATFGTARRRAEHVVAAPVAALPPFRSALMDALRDRSFRALVLSGSVFFLANVIHSSLAMHFLTYYARVPANEAFSAFLVASYVGALLGVGLWMRVARGIEKHHVYAGAMLALAAVVSGAYVLVGEGRPFGTGHVWVLVTGNALGGFVFSALWVLAPSMIADVAAHDEVRTRHRRDGMFFGIYSFGQQVSAGLGVLGAGILVDRFAGLVPGQAHQSADTIERLGMLFSLVPAALLIVSTMIILRYRLTRAEMGAARRPVESPSHAALQISE